MVVLLYQETTGKILRAYFDVYNGLSRPYPEFIFEGAMAKKLPKLGVSCVRQKEYQVFYKEYLVGLQQIDLLAANVIVIENKVVPVLLPIHKAQLYSYLKVTGKQVGLLLNFGSPKPEFERLHFDPTRGMASADPDPAWRTKFPDHYLYPELIGEILGTAVEVHRLLGPGFIHRVYANACHYEFRLRDIPAQPQREFRVIFEGEAIGVLKFGHFIVDDRVMFFPVAIQNIKDINVNNLKDWMRYRNIPIGVMVNFLATRIEPVFIVT